MGSGRPTRGQYIAPKGPQAEPVQDTSPPPSGNFERTGPEGLDPNKATDRIVGSIDTSEMPPSMARSIIRKAQIRGTDVRTWFTKSPTYIDPLSIGLAVNTVDNAVETIGLLNEQMATDLPTSPTAMALLPEMTAATKSELVGPMLLEALYGEDYNSIELKNATDTFHMRAYSEMGPRLSPDANLAVMLSAAGLEGRQLDSFLADVIAYLDNNDMALPNAESKFMIFQQQQAYGKQQEFLEGHTIIGAASENLSQGVRVTSAALSQTWAHAVAPQDAWYRDHMSPGQNFAISAGQDPGTAGYTRFSGTFDGVWNIVGDPLSYAANMAMGYKAVKGIPLLTQMSRTKLFWKAIVPFAGKRSFEKMGVRASTRFISNRLGMVMGARSSEQLTASPKAVRLWKVLSQVESPGIIVDRIPEWSNATDLVRAISKENDPVVIQQMVKQALEGAFDSADDLHMVARADLEAATSRFDGTLKRAVEPAEAVIPRGDGTGLTDLKNMDPADWAAVRNETTDVGILNRIDEYEQGLHAAPLGDDIDRAILKQANVGRGGNAEAMISDGDTLRAVLERGTHMLDEGFEGVTRNFDIGNGETGKVLFGETDGLEKVSIVTNEAGEVIGARIGQMAGVEETNQGRGIYGRILELQRDELGLTAREIAEQGGPLSEDAARVINRVFGGSDVSIGAAEGLGGYTARHGIWLADGGTPTVIDESGELKTILHQDAKILDYTGDGVETTWDSVIKYVTENFGPETDVTLDHVRSYAKAMGYDAIVDDAGKLEVLNQKMALTAADTDVQLTDEIFGSFMEWTEKQHASNSLNSGNRTSTWIVDEMPTGAFPTDVDKFNAVRPTLTGGSTSSSWWARAIKARVFGKFPPESISITDVAEGRKQLQVFLRYVGLHEDDVRRITEGFVDVSFVDRHRYVRDAVKEAAELIDNPIIKHNLIEYVDRGANASYGRVAGKEVLTTSSSVDVTEQAARPFIPSMLSNGVDLPDPVAFSKSLARFKTSKRMGPLWRRGFISKTKDKREALVAGVNRKLKKQYGDDFGEIFSPAEVEAMAYSVVGASDKGADGLGAVAHAAGAVNRVWKWGVSAFSISQLVGRFMPWYSRVWLDENFRAAFADLPTVMRSPGRFLGRHRDAQVLRRAGVYRAGALEHAATTMALFDDVDDVPTIWRMASGIVKNLDELIEDGQKLKAPVLKARLASLFNEAAIKNDYSQVMTSVSGRRQRIYQRAIDLAEDMGFDATKPDFNFAKEIPEIANQGFAQRFGLTHATRPLDWTETVTEAGEKQFASVYHQNLVQFTKDPLIRHTMNVIADQLSGSRNSRNTLVVLESNGYKRIEPYVAQWARENGLGVLDRPALLETYIDQVLAPFVREMYGPMLGDDTVEVARVMQSLAETGKVNIDLLDEVVELSFDGGSKGDTATEVLVTMARDAEFPNQPPPRTINANMTPFGFMDEDTDDWVDAAKQIPSRVFRFWGERMTQTGQRQPTYIDIFQREKAARMNFGMPEKAAIEMAHITAGEITNNIYYNTKSVTPFLKSMNNVVPFFTAAWEIASTWGYKIPMLQGGMGIGHAAVIRRVDRVTDAMRELGLLEYNDEGQPTLVLDVSARERPGSPGDEISRAAALTLQQPLKLLEHVMNLGYAVTHADTDRSDSAVPDRFEIMVSSPVDIESHGVGTAFDLALGAQPLIAFANTNLRKKIPLVAETKTVQFKGTLADFTAEHELDVFRTIALNMPAFEAAIGQDQLAQLLKGQLDPSTIDLTGLDITIPNTSLWSTLTTDIFFPYGDTDSMGDVATSFSPSWLSYAWRSMGVWQDGIDADGFVGASDVSPTESATSGQILSAARHMNFETGAFEKIDQYREEFYALATPYLEVGQAQMVDNELRWNGEKPADVDQVNAAWDKLTLYSDAVWVRAMEDGASMLMMRSFLSAILPGSPRLYFEEERTLDAYYQGKYTDNQFRRTDIDDVMDYVLLWAADPAGGMAVRKMLAENPTMGPYLVGKSYWGPGGVPPLDRSNEQYFSDLEAGLIRPMPHGAWRTREAIRNNEYERQIAVKMTYGENPYEVAALTLSDPQAYNEMSQPFTQKHHMFMWEDELRGSEYKTWKDRNRDDQFNIREEGIRKYNDVNMTISDTIQMLEITPLLNLAERAEATTTLKQMRAGINEFIEEMRVGDQNYDFLSGWQQLRMRWFEEGYMPYLDTLSIQYDLLEEADSSVEQDRIWAEIAYIEDKVGAVPVIIDGQEFPPPAVFKWNNKDEPVKEAKLLKAITYNAAWLDTATTERLVAQSPNLEKYLPTTPAQKQIWEEYTVWYDKIDERYDKGVGEISMKQRDKQRKNLNEQIRTLLGERGYTDQLTWMDFWPIQKLNESGQLPQSLQDSDWVQYVNGIQQVRSADGYKSVGDDDAGRRALTRLLMQEVRNNPVFREELVGLGIQLYGEELPEAIIPQLFFNDRF